MNESAWSTGGMILTEEWEKTLYLPVPYIASNLTGVGKRQFCSPLHPTVTWKAEDSNP